MLILSFQRGFLIMIKGHSKIEAFEPDCIGWCTFLCDCKEHEFAKFLFANMV